MKFKLSRHKISDELKVFASKMIKEHGIDSTRATKKQLRQIEQISLLIEKKGLPDHLVLKKLKGKLGHGIFLHPDAKPILKGDVIAPYAGEVTLEPMIGDDNSDYTFSLISELRLTKEEQLKVDPRVRFHPRRLYSLDLDADKVGNFTRFINHSAKPNIEAHFLKIGTGSRASYEIVYIAKKRIEPGEQLLVCYEGEEKSYWGALKIIPFPMTPKTFKLDSSLEFSR